MNKKDAIKCFDCQEYSLIELGGEVCPKCKSKNLLWANGNRQEMTEEEFNKFKELMK